MRPSYEFKLTRVKEVEGSHSIRMPVDAASYWNHVIEQRSWFQPNREHVITLLLNTQHRILGHYLVGIGTLNECTAHPRDILGPVLCGGAVGFVLMHNHPSGEPDPSDADRRLTRRVREGAELLRVTFVDHVIYGGPSRYYSFRESGLL